ncbi:hypothetical protein O181_072799 [Austropuccinia psidii MF-1]|uniref:Uncharacterized protein n=1 Tax=Austropuccinia psidii MF-1 TaxID=1389203 RepID=A0A9Q3F5G4_9BASI|nr:hypothetical protein [Austropuccinia psidii MF-1]
MSKCVSPLVFSLVLVLVDGHQPVRHLLSTWALSSIPQTRSQSAVVVYPPRPFGPNIITPPGCDHLLRDSSKPCSDCLVAAGIVQNPFTGMESLVIGSCFRMAANQCVGQAGRVAWRQSFPLHPESAYMIDVKNDTVPENERGTFANVVLLFKALGINVLSGMDCLEPPPGHTLNQVLDLLYDLLALNG